MSKELILAIDGGQTSTKAVLSKADGTIISVGSGPPCDHISGPNGREINRRAIHDAARHALENAAETPDRIVAVGMGLTSAAREHHAGDIFRDIVHEFCSPDVIWVDADFVSNLYGASAGAPGIVIIAGGGSIGYGFNGRGQEAIVGGLGFLMGDDGSAWYLGLRAIVAATHANDGRGRPTDLLSFVCEHYGLTSVREIIRVIYAADFTRDQVSSIAPDIVRIASHDEVAREIVTEAGRKLAGIVLATIRRVHEPGETVNVYPTGGVFAAGPLITEPFTTTIAHEWPTAVIREPRFSPVIGALLQAFHARGTAITPALLNRIDQTLS